MKKKKSWLKQKLKDLSLKKMYYLAFLFLIVIPLLTVLLVALLYLNIEFKNQAIENIERAQDSIITELLSDISVMSMRLSHLVHTNNSEMIGYVAEADTEDIIQKYENEQKLSQAVNFALEPSKDIIAVGFHMKDGKDIYVKNMIERTKEEIKNTAWYQAALKSPNTVCVGSYDTKSANDLYRGGKKDSLVLVFAFSPDETTDRSRKIEMVTFYQTSNVGDVIKKYDTNYRKGNNKLGITRITDENGAVLFTTVDTDEFAKADYTCVRKQISFGNTVWYVESFIRTRELTESFWHVAGSIIFIAILIFLLAGCYSHYFLKRIVNPITEISGGLKQVEEGNLQIHITPQGQSEIRNMIHQFNAMVRRLDALIEEYEEKSRRMQRRPEIWFAAMIKGEAEPEDVAKQSPDFFAERYALIEIIPEHDNKVVEREEMEQIAENFARNPRFASRCIIYVESASALKGMYRISEDNYFPSLVRMLRELQTSTQKDFEISFSACIGKERYGWESFAEGLKELQQGRVISLLYGEQAVIDLRADEKERERILLLSDSYKRLASMLYIADEKNMTEEREKLFLCLESSDWEEGVIQACAAILAVRIYFDENDGAFWKVFEGNYDYMGKIRRLEDIRGLKMWLTNYFAWIMDYSATKLNVMETDVIVKAKRYIADHYDDAELSLSQVAGYVELNDKYFTNRFTKETGETFSAYVTGLRMQKAKELLRTTTFKIYEISEMVGYHNVEHFTRTFKKWNQVSPAQYRKAM